MVEFTDADDFRGARFTGTKLNGARFRDVDLSGAKVVDSLLIGADISGHIDGLRINDVEVAPLIHAELNRRDPDRQIVFSASDPDRMRRAWSVLEDRWAATMDRARRLPEDLLHERVDEEWSFVETLRHLIFVTDAWVARTILGEATPFHPMGLPNGPVVGIDTESSPSFDEVASIRMDRQATVRRIVEEMTDEEWYRTCDPNPAPGHPEFTEQLVLVCLAVLLTEEWEHHQYAIRDLAVLETVDSGG